ncbi:MAG: DUF2497 domain-containing protein [Rhizobiaceae bacterium]
MAQASNAQREPSMEEILASIRRIIEDSDTAADAGVPVDAAAGPAHQTAAIPADRASGTENVDAGMETPSGEAAAAGGETAAATGGTETEGVYEPAETVAAEAAVETAAENVGADAEVEAFRQEFTGDAGSEAADRSMSALNLSGIGDEVARQAGPASEEDEEGGDEAAADDGAVAIEPETGNEDEDAGAGETIASALGDEWRHIAEGAVDHAASSGGEGAAGYDAATDTDAALAALARSIASEAMEPDRPEPQAGATAHGAGEAAPAARPPILSEQAGRQVAAAFDELSEAFAGTRRKSFDEMAEEMLRPMLQDWLDNNLPVLVERLVREEIDRVARGGSH